MDQMWKMGCLEEKVNKDKKWLEKKGRRHFKKDDKKQKAVNTGKRSSKVNSKA